MKINYLIEKNCSDKKFYETVGEQIFYINVGSQRQYK